MCVRVQDRRRGLGCVCVCVCMCRREGEGWDEYVCVCVCRIEGEGWDDNVTANLNITMEHHGLATLNMETVSQYNTWLADVSIT